MLSEGTYAPKDPMLLTEFLKVCSSNIVVKDLPSFFPLKEFPKQFP
jgi:hypothetical protein